jgi:dolichol-phosphate hexosyltransferase
MNSLSVLIPIYNEERTIHKLSQSLIDLPSNFLSQVVIVDDGSTDGSANNLQNLLKESRAEVILHRKLNGGKGSAIKEGIQFLKGSHAVILDADLELDTTDLIPLFQPILDEKAQATFGVRKFSSQSSFTYRYVIGNKFLSHLYGLLFNHYLRDIMCGAKLLPTSVWKDLDLKLNGFNTEVEIAAKLWRRNIRPWEVEVSYSPRTREEGKGITVFDAIKIIFVLFVLRVKMSKKS